MRRGYALAMCAVLCGCATGIGSGADDPIARMIDPQVRERHVGESSIVEYRENGHLQRIVKITTPDALPTYFSDDDGDGRIDRQIGDVPHPYTLNSPIPFEEIGLIGMPLPPRTKCGIAIRALCK